MTQSAEHDNPNPVAGIVLAAGSAERFGRRPKCLLELDGVPLIQRVVLALTGAGVTPVIVVLGHYRNAIAAALEPAGLAAPAGSLRMIINEHPELGQNSSLRAGLVAVGAQARTILVALADLPLLDSSSVAAALAAWRQRPAGTDLLFPEVKGERGHPVIMSRVVRDDILAAGGDFGGRQWQARHPDRVWQWPAIGDAFICDIDQESDRQRFELKTGRRLHWPGTLKME